MNIMKVAEYKSGNCIGYGKGKQTAMNSVRTSSDGFWTRM